MAGRLHVDLTEAQSFELAEPGPYIMTVDSFDDPEQKEKGTGLNIYFRFEDPDVDQKCGVQRRFFMLTGKGSGFFREFWKAATGEDLAVGESYDIDSDDAIGKRVMVEVSHRADDRPGKEGNQYNELGKITAV